MRLLLVGFTGSIRMCGLWVVSGDMFEGFWNPVPSAIIEHLI